MDEKRLAVWLALSGAALPRASRFGLAAGTAEDGQECSIELVARVVIVIVALLPQRQSRPELGRAGNALTLILVAPLTDFSKELIVAEVRAGEGLVPASRGGQ